MKKVILSACVLLAGCATQKEIHLPDGRVGHAIDCSGTAFTWNECYAKAGKICQSQGYEVISKEGEETSAVSGNQYGLYAASGMKRSFVVACGKHEEGH